MTIVIFCFQTLRDNIYLLIAVLVMVLIAAIVVGLKILVSDYEYVIYVADLINVLSNTVKTRTCLL